MRNRLFSAALIIVAMMATADSASAQITKIRVTASGWGLAETIPGAHLMASLKASYAIGNKIAALESTLAPDELILHIDYDHSWTPPAQTPDGRWFLWCDIEAIVWIGRIPPPLDGPGPPGGGGPGGN